MMNGLNSKLLAEVLRLQRRAGGDSVSASRIFGLMNGFESELSKEAESSGISRAAQDKVEDVLQDILDGKQSPDGHDLKERLIQDDIDEIDATKVMELCLLEGRYTDVIEELVNDLGCPLQINIKPPEMDWFGAIHYMELVDTTEETHKKLHSVWAPCIPRVGEIVTPQGGSTMIVVGVEHLVAEQGTGAAKINILIPHVLLESIDEDDDDN